MKKKIVGTVFELEMVRGAGLEPACLTAKDPKSFVSANFTSRA